MYFMKCENDLIVQLYADWNLVECFFKSWDWKLKYSFLISVLKYKTYKLAFYCFIFLFFELSIASIVCNHYSLIVSAWATHTYEPHMVWGLLHIVIHEIITSNDPLYVIILTEYFHHSFGPTKSTIIHKKTKAIID